MEVNLNGDNTHDTRAHRGPTHVSISLPESLKGFPKRYLHVLDHLHRESHANTLNGRPHTARASQVLLAQHNIPTY